MVVPVPTLEEYVHGRWAHYDPAWVSTDPAFTHAHITVLAPFKPSPTPADLDALARIAATTRAFDFTLTDVASFPNGIIHALPTPAAPLAELTERVTAMFPGLVPYAGEFDPVPHVTLDHTAPGIDPETVRTALGDTLPAYCRAERLELHWYAEGDCHVLRSWPFGG